MEREQQIKLDLDSLCVYKGIFNEGIGDKFRILVDKISSGEYISECIKAYNEFIGSLFTVSRNLSFKEAIVSEMLLSNNPFNNSIDESNEIPEFIVAGINNELEFLGRIVEVDSKVIKDILISKYAPNKELINRINSLIDFGLSEEKYNPKNLTDFERIKAKFINEDNWGEKAEYILEFHRRNGTGRAAAFSAFVWERFENEEEGHLREILEPDPIRLKDLIGYESQKQEIITNTKNFLSGIPSNNLLLYGSRGTGKSSTVKAILNEFYTQGLRLIEVDKEQLNDFTRIIRLLKHKKQKFIIFVDDLVFADNEASYSALKTILEGRIENRPDNILIYATTNRRHLVQEKFSDRDDEVHSKDNQEEKLSLADRFGITISFFAPDQKEFLKIVDGIVESRGLDIDTDYLHEEALKWEKWHNGRSPRSAKQFIDWLEGEIRNKDKKEGKKIE
ncbi:MAG: ATP-binding protein [Clostridiales bacterium]|nr:ATP-binding protein [Clostridiales bacterium]